MRSGRPLLVLLCLCLACCHGGGGSSSSTASSQSCGIVGNGTIAPVQGANVLLLTVNGSECDPANSVGYANKACVSVTVCAGATCQTVNDILLDTGSYGLRVFYSVLGGVGPLLTPVASGGGSLYECITYGDGTSDWGYVAKANVQLAGDTANSVPIQVINPASGASPPGACQSPHTGPGPGGSIPAYYNGVLGVGPLVYDCGNLCATGPISSPWPYYSCTGGGACTLSTVVQSDQVQNPVAAISTPAFDNNGVIVELPGVPTAGLPSVNGFLVLGIGTETNNVPSGVTVYGLNQLGEFVTSFNGASLNAIADTGTNGLLFRDPSLPVNSELWFDPSSPVCLSATIEGASGAPASLVGFQIGNAQSLLASSNYVFSNLGASGSNGFFGWGLPFFLGRNVYIGINGRPSSLATGPYIAY